jgi:5-methylcytosine-specific restriction endonuclease McrA
MSWLRVSDTASSHPRLLAVLDLPDADEMLTHLVFSFISRCMVTSAQKRQDYLITSGQAREAAMTSALLKKATEAAIAVGLMEEVAEDDEARELLAGAPGTIYRLMDDPDFMHMRLRAEIEWDAQRKADNRNSAITAPVRARDGDACRYCGKSVVWGDGQSARGATFDHLHPGKSAEGVDDLVVACRACNGRRGDGDELTLLEAPSLDQRLISKRTAVWLTSHGITTDASFGDRKEWNAQVKASEARAAAAQPQAETRAEQTARIRERAFESLREARGAAEQTPSGAPGEVLEEMLQGASEDVPDLSPTCPRDAGLPSPDGPGRVGTGRSGAERAWAGLGGRGAAQPPPKT